MAWLDWLIDGLTALIWAIAIGGRPTESGHDE